MWVRSQDKENLLNNPLRIYIKKSNKNISDFEIKGTTYDECICLGVYKSKERALEVLDEIQRLIEDLKYMEYAIDKNKFCGYRSNVYKMPEV